MPWLRRLKPRLEHHGPACSLIAQTASLYYRTSIRRHEVVANPRPDTRARSSSSILCSKATAFLTWLPDHISKHAVGPALLLSCWIVSIMIAFSRAQAAKEFSHDHLRPASADIEWKHIVHFHVMQMCLPEHILIFQPHARGRIQIIHQPSWLKP